MKTVLHIDASARVSRSLSRTLSAKFVETWKEKRPQDRVIHRDLGLQPPPAISEETIAALFTAESERTAEQAELLALSDELIAELEPADLIVLATPMYNYGMPTALKGWVDQVIRIGKTFTFDLDRGDFPLEPILSGKTMVILTSTGEFGFEPGGMREKWDHLVPHIKTIQHYLGVEESHHIGIEYQEFGGKLHDDSIAGALARVEPLVDAIAPRFNG